MWWNTIMNSDWSGTWEGKGCSREVLCSTSCKASTSGSRGLGGITLGVEWWGYLKLSRSWSILSSCWLQRDIRGWPACSRGARGYCNGWWHGTWHTLPRHLQVQGWDRGNPLNVIMDMDDKITSVKPRQWNRQYPSSGMGEELGTGDKMPGRGPPAEGGDMVCHHLPGLESRVVEGSLNS